MCAVGAQVLRQQRTHRSLTSQTGWSESCSLPMSPFCGQLTSNCSVDEALQAVRRGCDMICERWSVSRMTRHEAPAARTPFEAAQVRHQRLVVVARSSLSISILDRTSGPTLKM